MLDYYSSGLYNVFLVSDNKQEIIRIMSLHYWGEGDIMVSACETHTEADMSPLPQWSALGWIRTKPIVLRADNVLVTLTK